MNGFGSGSSMWLSSFDLSTKDTPPQFDVMKKLNEVFKQVSPFYKQVCEYFTNLYLLEHTSDNASLTSNVISPKDNRQRRSEKFVC